MSIYLDNAATTRPFDEIRALFERYMQDGWYNPSAMYPEAVDIEKRMDQARAAIAAGVSAAKDGVIFTSGGTEGSNTVALRGWRGRGARKLSFITSAYEHACVYNAFGALKEQGHDVIYVRPRKDGFVHAEDVADAVREDTALVSVMHVNNETGAVNDIKAICAAVKAKNPDALFHSDGVQAYMRVPLDFATSGIDYYTVSAHKIHGLKGAGAIFYKKGAPIKALIEGGGQEKNLRSGTENTLGILAFGEAARIYAQRREEYVSHMLSLRAQLDARLSAMPGFHALSPAESFAPHIYNAAFDGMRGEVLLHLLEREGVSISTGAACSSKKSRSFRIHEHTRLKNEVLEGAVRISLCPFNTSDEIDEAADKIASALSQFTKFRRR